MGRTNTQKKKENQLKRQRTESRLGNLLTKIRSLSQKKTSKAGKTKDVYLKWMRFCPIKERYLNVKSNEGGGARFIEQKDNEPCSFGEIKNN